MSFILAAKRLPQGRYLGALAKHSAVELGRCAVEGLLSDSALPRPAKVIWGMARSHGNGMNPARTLALKAGLPVETTAHTINMACGSSLQALIEACRTLEEEGHGPILAGGGESMSNTPHLLLGLHRGLRMGHREAPDVMFQDGLRCPITRLLMGETIERLAAKRGVGRGESDAWALQSHQRAAAADFTPELLPHPDLDHDECVRRDADAATLARLAPVFGGQVTAGNASAISDGAAALLVAREPGDAKPLARILGWAEAGVDPMDMGEAPVPAVHALLKAHGLGTRDIALWELNEAFAAQVLV